MRLKRVSLVLFAVVSLLIATIAPGVSAADDPPPLLELPDRGHMDDGSHDDDGDDGPAPGPNPDGSITHLLSSGSTTDGLELEGRGVRNVANATTDVWVYDEWAYTGTFNSPCGGEADAGIWVWDIDDTDSPRKAGVILSPEGSRTNDVRVDGMNSGDVLVHSNESCNGGPGGFEIYNVDNPKKPVALASVRIDDPNPLTPLIFGPIEDVGVHNLWLFTQGDNDYVGVTTETAFGIFQIFDITDPSNPALVSSWGAEETFDPGVNASGDIDRTLNAAIWLTSGFGNSANRFLHDVTINEDGTRAYLSNWDAGLILLDISDPANPSPISVAIDEVNGSLDGEVNSHSAWPNEDGTVVAEGEEDFSAWEALVPPSNVTFGDLNEIPGVIVSTGAGDDLQANSGTAGSISATSVTQGGSTYPATEFSGNNFPLGDTTLTGSLVFIGRACTGDVIEAQLAEGDIAVARRGACNFSEKANNAAAAGASAIVIANNNPISTPWSGIRIWDYSDEANPVLASTINTECSASTAPSETCRADGTYSSHNVQIEDNKLYVSWYSDGIIVYDISDPYNPVELTRFVDASTNGGEPLDFWGIYLEPGEDDLVYASDRNGGLYIFENETEDADDRDDDDDDRRSGKRGRG